MAFAETAQLIARLSLKDDFSRPLSKVKGQVQGLGQSLSRAGKVAGIAVGAAVTVGAAVIGRSVKSGLDSLAELESATTSVDGAIKQMGLTGQVTSTQIAGWANEIESSIQAAFDDKEITQAATTLLRFGKVTTTNLKPALTVVADLATKTGSVESAASLLAKALADPEKAAGKLARTGVVLTKSQQDQIKAMVKAGKVGEAQALILDSVAKATEGAAKAANGPYVDSQKVLADVIEDSQRALATGFLPILEEVRKELSTELAKPETLNRIREFGEGLAGGVKGLIGIAKGLPWQQIGDAFKLLGQGSKAALDLFTGLPPWVQTAVLTGWGLNKLTGGALSGIVGELGKGLIKGVLGMNAGVVNIKAGVVTGGAPSVPGGPVVPGGGGGISTLGKVFLVGEAIGLVAAVASVADAIGKAGLAQAKDIHTVLDKSLAESPSVPDLLTKLGGINEGIEKLAHDPITAAIYHDTLVELETMRTQVVAALDKQTASQDTRESARIAQISGPTNVPDSHKAPGDRKAQEIVIDTKKTQELAAAQRDRIEATRIALITKGDATIRGVDTARTAIAQSQRTAASDIRAGVRSGDADIVAAIRANRPVITVHVGGGYTTKVTTGGTINRTQETNAERMTRLLR